MNYIIHFFLYGLLTVTIYSNDPIIYQLSINSAIGPAVADYIERGIQKGIENKASAILITIDTPGGLDQSIKHIVQTIVASPIPIISYVYPAGSHTLHTSTNILYASHIIAMTPGTHIGKRTPHKRPIHSPLQSKIITNEKIPLKRLADTHHRNKEESKKNTKKTTSLTAFEAKNKNIIDIVAQTPNHVIKNVSEKQIIINNKTTIISADARLIPIIPDLKTKLLTILTNPDIAYLLLVTGIYCVMFEISTPGLIIPGIIGIMSLSLSLFGLNLLPISWLGLSLIIMGGGCLVAEIVISSFGLFGILGSIIFLIGSLLLIEPNTLNLSVNNTIIIMSTLINILFFVMAITIMIQTKKSSQNHGVKTLVGKEGTSLESFKNEGKISIQGEIWKAQSSHPIKRDEKVIITNIKNQTLIITSKKEKSS